MAIPGQFTKLNVCQSVFVATSPNLMPAECTSPMICRPGILYGTEHNGICTSTELFRQSRLLQIIGMNNHVTQLHIRKL